MNKTYFNNKNGNTYEVLARYFDDVMLLKSEGGNYIVARWINNGEWGSGHYWMTDKKGAVDDFFKTAYEEYKYNHAWEEQMTIEEFKKFYEEY